MLHSEAHESVCSDLSGTVEFTAEETDLTLYGVVSSLYCLSGCLYSSIAMCFERGVGKIFRRRRNQALREISSVLERSSLTVKVQFGRLSSVWW